MSNTIDSLLVVGCGSAGARHAKNLQKLGVQRIVLFDPDDDDASRLASELSAETVDSVEDGLKSGVDGVVVASPPNRHLDASCLAIEAGVSCFVEKPFAESLDGLGELVDLAEQRELFIMIGYNLRYFSPLIELKRMISSGKLGRILTVRAEFGQYLPTWRKDGDYRKNYIASPWPVGGIILEESHEFDCVQWLAGPVDSVYCAAGKLSDLDLEAEDTALIVMRHKNGTLSHISVDCTQRGYKRGVHVVGTEGTASWTFPGELSIVRDAGDPEIQNFDQDFNTTYELEMGQFLECLRGSAVPEVGGREAMESLRITLAARESASSGSEVGI